MSLIQFNKDKSIISIDSINNNNINQIEEEMNEFIKNLNNYLKTDSKTLTHWNNEINGEYFKYWDYKEAQILKNNLKETYSIFKNYLNIIKEYDCQNILEFIEFYEDFENEISIINNNYVEEEIDRNKEFFDELNLNEGQREAVVVDEDSTQIIAGAGTGKTRTLISNVKYLIEKKNINPSKILCLSYSRKATNDLIKRIKNMGISASYKQEKDKVRVSTFHSFGNSFIFDEFNKNILEDIFENYIKEEIKKDISLFESFKLFYFNSEIRSGFSTEDTTGIAIKYKNSEDRFLAFNGKSIVKTFPELKIIDFLILNGIKYEYEKEYPIPYKNGLKAQCDFYLPDYNIYIEDFRLSKDNKVPWLSKKEEKEYLNQMNFKLGLKDNYEMKDAKIITVNSLNNNYLKELESKLKDLNVTFKPMSNKRKEKIIEHTGFIKDLKEIKDTVEDFIKSFKEHNYQNDKIHSFKGETEKENFMLRFIADYYDYYENYLNENNLIDFTDMIIKAIPLIKNVDYEYIFVDEYQDISEIRFELLKRIKEESNGKLIVVGDDWQSIYGFSGCDVKYFANFKEYFPNSKEVYLNKTYRSPNQLINVAGDFVDDEHLITKELYCEKDIEKPIKLCFHSNKQDELIYSILEEISEKADSYEKNGVYLEENREVMILSRYNENLDNIKGKLNSIYASENLKLNIEYNTFHGAKGLESGNVIIIDVNNDTKGIPSKIETTGILRFVSFSNNAKKQELEERRLFYVGLTRTMTNVYLCTPRNKQSEYIKELDKNQIEKITFKPPTNYNPFSKNSIKIVKQFWKYRKLVKKTGLKCRSCGKGDINIYEINKINYVVCSEYNENCKWMIQTKIRDIDNFNLEYCPDCSEGIIYEKENNINNKKVKIKKCNNIRCKTNNKNNNLNYQRIPINKKRKTFSNKDMPKTEKPKIKSTQIDTEKPKPTKIINQNSNLEINNQMKTIAQSLDISDLNKDQKMALDQLKLTIFRGDKFRSDFKKQLDKYGLTESEGYKIYEEIKILIKNDKIKRNGVRTGYLSLMKKYSKK